MKLCVMYTDHTVIICHDDEHKNLLKGGWKLYKEAYNNEDANKYAEECCYI